jgi:hypothetical protein
MKRKSLTLLVCLLACLALGSVGFAAWVITNDANAEDSGTIRVDVVKDARLSISAEIVEGEPIIFGSKEKDPKVANNWMKYEETDDNGLKLNENLTSVIKIVIGNFEYVDKLTITLTEDQTAHYAEALAKGYVAELPKIELTQAELQALVDKEADDNNKIENGELTVYLDINFKWGKAFDGKNPIDYYNAQTYTDILGNESIARLQELREMFEGVEGTPHTLTYVATVEVTTK